MAWTISNRDTRLLIHRIFRNQIVGCNRIKIVVEEVVGVSVDCDLSRNWGTFDARAEVMVGVREMMDHNIRTLPDYINNLKENLSFKDFCSDIRMEELVIAHLTRINKIFFYFLILILHQMSDYD